VRRRRVSEIVTWCLVAGAVVTGVLALVIDRDEPTTGEQEARAGMLLRVWRQDDVTRVTIVRDGEKTEIVRDGDNWRMTSPRVVSADFLAVSSLLNALGGARSERIVEHADFPERRARLSSSSWRGERARASSRSSSADAHRRGHRPPPQRRSSVRSSCRACIATSSPTASKSCCSRTITRRSSR